MWRRTRSSRPLGLQLWHRRRRRLVRAGSLRVEVVRSDTVVANVKNIFEEHVEQPLVVYEGVVNHLLGVRSWPPNFLMRH